MVVQAVQAAQTAPVQAVELRELQEQESANDIGRSRAASRVLRQTYDHGAELLDRSSPLVAHQFGQKTTGIVQIPSHVPGVVLQELMLHRIVVGWRKMWLF